MVRETITITEIDGRKVWYDGSRGFHGCDIGRFPSEPEVGDKYYLVHDGLNPSFIEEIENGNESS